MMLGYITLQSVPPLGQASLAKQAQVRHQIKCVCRYLPACPACPACLSQCLTSQEISDGRGCRAANPSMPVYKGGSWGLLLCDAPTNLTNKNASCLMEYDARIRADPEVTISSFSPVRFPFPHFDSKFLG